MKVVNVGNGRIYDVPETWAEAEKMVNGVLRASGRGRNGEIMSVCSRISYGLCCNQSLTPDPTTALLYLMQRICQRKGAGLER